MQSAADIAEQAIAKMEIEENGHAPEPTTQSEDTKGQSAAGKDDTGARTERHDDKKPDDDTKGDDKPEKSDEPDKKDDEEGQFTADDALEVEEQAEPDAPTTDNAGIQLSTAEQKHIVDNIGEPLVIRGYRGEGDNRREVEIKAYTPGDIPRDFKFMSDADLVAAQTGFTRLENKAEQLLGSYRNQQSQSAAKDYERRENEGIRLDVSDLQREGLFPKFKIQPGQRGFDDDPAAQQMSEVLQLMTERNQTYLQQWQQGRQYKHIGFREAFELWEKQQAPKRQAEAQKQEDAERKKVADKVGNDRGMSQSKLAKPRVRSGTTVNDILARHEVEDW